MALTRRLQPAHGCQTLSEALSTTMTKVRGGARPLFLLCDFGCRFQQVITVILSCLPLSARVGNRIALNSLRTAGRNAGNTHKMTQWQGTHKQKLSSSLHTGRSAMKMST